MKTLLFLIAVSTLNWGLSQDVELLKIEPNHSTIGFSIPISGGITRVTGKFMDFDLQMDYIDQDLTQSSAQFIIQTSSINTGIAARDEHLRSSDFLDAEEYPQIIFASSNIQKSSSGYILDGILTMHGVDKKVSIPFELLHQENTQLGIQIRWKLNRLDFGVGKDWQHTAVENFLGDEIDIEINFWTQREKQE